MSTSSSAAQRQPISEASPFPYAEAELASGAATPAGGNPQTAEEQNRTLQAAAFEQGRQAAQQQLRAELESALGKNRQQITAVLQQFALERQNYYRSVEGEIVQLALAIARKILHREAQLDPRALAGIVRVTLENSRPAPPSICTSTRKKPPTGATISPVRWKESPHPKFTRTQPCPSGSAASRPHSEPPKSAFNRNSRKSKPDCSTCSPKGLMPALRPRRTQILRGATLNDRATPRRVFLSS